MKFVGSFATNAYNFLALLGHTEATFESDDTWRGLKAKADRLDHLRYAVLQKLHMERAKSEAQLQSGPRLYQGNLLSLLLHILPARFSDPG